MRAVIALSAAAALNFGCEPPPAFEETDLATQPLSGTIDGHAFAFVSGQMNKVGDSYLVSLKNYAWECGANSSLPEVDPALVVNFGVLVQGEGLDVVRFGDEHAAALQVGVSEGDVDSNAVEDGLIRLGTWDTAADAEISGALVFAAGDSKVNGRFTATVCP